MRKSAFLLFGLFLFGAPASAVDTELYTFHCLFGCPVGAPATNDTIVREIYTLSSNDLTKMADWVAYRVTSQTVGPSQGQRNYRIEPWLDPSETLDESAYTGAPAALHIDHGHQAPLAAFSGSPQWDDTNFDSNMTPQASALNQGAWQYLEARERSLVLQTMKPVYVYTGPLFERLMKPLPNGPQYHRVPSGYWKIIALADGHVTAFIMDQNTPRNAKYCDFRLPLIDVELRTRLQFFPRRGNVQLSSLDSQLGCTTPSPPPSPRSEITTH